MIVSWEALSFVFSLIPGIVGIAYCYTCGRFRNKPAWSGYIKMWKIAKNAEDEAYKKTAKMITPSNSPLWIVGLLACIFSLIVSLVGPNTIITVVCLFLCIPISITAYFIGKHQFQIKE